MKDERGNISIMFLMCCLFLAAVLQAVVLFCSRTAEREQEYLRGQQLRQLCNSVGVSWAKQDLAAGTEVLGEAVLYPGQEAVTITGKAVYSTDNLFRYMDVTAEGARHSYSLRQMRFELAPVQREQAQQQMFISDKSISGAEVLDEAGVAYTSGAEVVMPAMEFLKNGTDKRSISEVPMDDLRQYGLVKRFYYLPAETGVLTFTDNLKVYGTAVIATEGNIIIGKGCQFTDRVILLANGTITIGEGAVLNKALLMSYGKLSVGAGCTLRGVAFSGGTIEILGQSVLEHDESVVAPFSSAFYII